MGLFGLDYPPGVSGNEYEIAGADYEKEYPDECPQCGTKDSLIEQGYRHQAWVTCSECDYQFDLEIEILNKWDTDRRV